MSNRRTIETTALRIYNFDRTIYSISVRCSVEVVTARSKEIGLYGLLDYSSVDRFCSVVFFCIVASTVICVFLSLNRYLVPATALFCFTLHVASYYLVSISVISQCLFEFQSFGFNFHETSTYSDMKQLSVILLAFSILHYIVMCIIPARYRLSVCLP